MSVSTTASLLRILRHQTVLLERLRLAHLTLELLVVTGETAFLPTAADEAEDLLDALAVVETARAVTVSQLADELGVIGDEPSLDEVAAALPAEAAAPLRAVGAQLRAATEGLGAGGGDARALASQRLGRVRDSLARLETGLPGGGYSVRLSGGAVAPVRFDGGA